MSTSTGPRRVVGGSAAEEMEEREKLVCLAKLAEQAERYNDEGSHSRALCLIIMPRRTGLQSLALFSVPFILGKSVASS
jgi:hypothetical protein